MGMLRAAGGVGALVFVLLGACGGTSSSSSPPPPPAPANGPPPQGACGVQVFRTNACQAALDSVCCALETRCARDPGCARLTQCMIGCKLRGMGTRQTDNCVNGCGIQARVDYCQGACRGGPADCVDRCTRQGGPGDPNAQFEVIAGCSKGVNYPPGVRCDDDT